MEDLIGSYSIQTANGKRSAAYSGTGYKPMGTLHTAPLVASQWNAAYSGTRYMPIATLHTEAMVIKEMLYILIVSVLQNEFQEHHPCQ